MSLRTSYRLLAPFYDVFLARATARLRQRSLAHLPRTGQARVLLCGAGTGLDFPYLPPEHEYTALDLTPAMLRRGRHRGRLLNLQCVQGDSMALPFADESFDHVVLHLILAVVPCPEQCLAEASRVLKPGGKVLVFDKFLRRGEAALLRRMVNPVSRRLATRLDVVFEEVLEHAPGLMVVRDEPTLLGGWFRLIGLKKERS